MARQKKRGRIKGEHRTYITATAAALPATPRTRELKGGDIEIVYNQKPMLGKDLCKVKGVDIHQWEVDNNQTFNPDKVYLYTNPNPDYIDHEEAMLKIYSKQGLSGVANYIKRIKKIVVALERKYATKDTI